MKKIIDSFNPQGGKHCITNSLKHESSRSHYQTPEERYCQKVTLAELMSVLESCTATQKERFLLYALDDLGYTKIVRRCGCSKVYAYESIEAVRKKYRKYFADRPNNSSF